MSTVQTVHVKGLDGLEKLQKRTKVTETALPSYQLYLVRNISEKDVLSVIHGIMKGCGVSQKIIDGTKITRVEFVGKIRIRVYVVSRYFVGSFDVAKARHDGTKSHWVEPQEKKALHFEGFFSKGHSVSGLPRLEYITKTIQRLQSHVSDELNRQTRMWVAKMLEVT